MHTDREWITKQAAKTLQRLKPRIVSALPEEELQSEFLTRLAGHFETIFEVAYSLYGGQYDFFYHLQTWIDTALAAYRERSSILRDLDRRREQNPAWYQDNKMVGAVCYVDLFAGSLAGLEAKIPYLEELGITYLHLMPVFASPEQNNDGGYAVSSFREVNPRLGTMQQLEQLAHKLRKHGISLVLDFVFNHTSNEHPWAVRALAGDEEYQAYYRFFDDRSIPNAYEPYLREIFPEQAPGSFTYLPELNKWVWTTFYSFQWDLNYANPQLFRAMLEEMFFLANRGVEILRLDAVPFIWKELGTNCENLPQVNMLIRAYNAFMRVVCPSLLFKSEAIVHPRDVRSYIGEDKCQLSYNPIMMVSLWEALATREVYFFTHTMQKQFPLEGNTSWINYVRSHDDIGWGFADEDAQEVGIIGSHHRYFLNQFYTGAFPGSFAAGQPFNYNPRTGDMRISGTCASLAGLEKALLSHDPAEIGRAVKRILLIYGICFSAGGIPLIYLGDEVGTLNNYAYADDPEKKADSRWLHRPPADERLYESRHDPASVPGMIFNGMLRMLRLRKAYPQFSNGNTRFVSTSNKHVLAFVRNEQMLVLANFSEHRQSIEAQPFSGFLAAGRDLLGDSALSTGQVLQLEPYQLMWIIPAGHEASPPDRYADAARAG
ncbi:alpha-amylase family glycosyl hydrolase [Kamptonema cortianum]|nr:alpha-amylase family glycosyl hydrolase [Kamptonema cortianum]